MKVISDASLATQYLLKYVTKQELKTKYLEQLDYFAATTESNSIMSLAARLIFKASGKRDMSAQEVASITDKNQIYDTDINFVTVSLGDDALFRGGTLERKTHFIKYLTRPLNDENLYQVRVRKTNKPNQFEEKGVTYQMKNLRQLSFMDFYTFHSDVTYNSA